MDQIICVTKCFYLGRVWEVGEALPSGPKGKLPKHFKPASEVKITEPDSRPKTFKEIQQADARQALAAVGHADQAGGHAPAPAPAADAPAADAPAADAPAAEGQDGGGPAEGQGSPDFMK